MGLQLGRLSAYHHGRPYDFTNTRDRYLARIVRFARENSEYYAANLPPARRGGLSPRDEAWKSVPLLDKALIREKSDTLMTTPRCCPWVGELTTGGSTGEPFGFPYMGGHDAEHQKFLWKMHGYSRGDRILTIDGTRISDADLAEGRYWVKKSDDQLPYGGTALSGHYLNSRTKGSYLQFLLDFQPEFIRGYPSLVSQIAVHAYERNIHLGCKAVELSSESHTREQIEIIEKSIGPVFDQYGHAEASMFGYSLESSGPIFCSPVYGLVEILDDAGHQVEPGEMGEVVVTGFHNYAQPFIRYRTGDRAVLGGESDGIVRLTSVVGRTQDYLLSGDGEKHLLTALVFGRHYAAMARIDRWQLIQDIPGEVVMRIARGAGYGVEDEDEIRRNFHDLAKIEARFDYDTPIFRSDRAKTILVIHGDSTPRTS